jgi:hypothetical protein
VLDAKGVMEPYEEPRQARGWLTLILGVVVFSLFGGVVGYAWFSGLGEAGGEPPLIRAEAGPYRRAPAERGGLEVANVSSSIVSVLRPKAEPPRVERLLPPETPMALEAAPPEEDEVPPAPSAMPAPPASTADEPAPPVTKEPAPPAAVTEAPPADAAPAEPPPAPADVANKPVPEPKPEPPAQLAAPEPAPTALPPPRPPASAAPARPAPPVPPAPQRLARVEPTATLPARPASPPPSARGGDLYRLQLTAVRSESGLTQAWAQLKQRYPRVLANLSPKVERVETSTGPLFRLQAGPFTTREAAANACSGIRESGGQCFIIGPVP